MRRILLLLMLGLAFGPNHLYAQISVDEAFQCELDPNNQKVCLLSWSPNGRWIATTTKALFKVDIWDAETHTLFRTIPTHADALTWNSEGDQLAMVTEYAINIWDVESGEQVNTIDFTDVLQAEFDNGTRAVWTDVFTSIDWNDETSQIAIVSPYVWIAVWSLSSNRFEVLELPSGYEPEVNPHDGAPLSVAWNPPGDQLAVAFDVWGIVMYDGETLEIEELYGNGGYFLNGYPGLQSLTWSPDGRFLATDGISFMDGSDIVVRILEVSTGEFTFIPGQEEIINAVVWSPSGDFIVTGTGRFPTPSQDNSLRIWDTTTYEQIQELLFDTPITSISWNPNSTQLAAVDLDGAVYIIDVQG